MLNRCSNIISSYLEYTEKQESPDSFHIWCCLSMIASCLRRQVWVDMSYFKVYPNMYIVLVARSGRCRKSAAINISTSLLQDMEDIKIGADATTKEALIKFLNDSTTVRETPDNKIYYHASLTVISKELSVFLGTKNMDLLSVLTDLYDCPNKWEYKTKNMGTDYIHNVWINLLGASTPDWLTGSIPINAIGGGFTSRVIFVVENESRVRNAIPQLSENEKLLRNNIIHDLEQISMMYGEMKLTNEAAKFYDDWYKSISEYDMDRNFWGYMERKHIHLLKVAMIISASRGIMTIDVDSLTVALNMLNSIEPKMVEAFGSTGRSVMAPDVGEVMEIIKNFGAVSKAELTRMVWKNVSMDVLDKVLATLRNMNLITQYYDTSINQLVYKWRKTDETHERTSAEEEQNG